jgi:putative flippase GtrA
MLAACFVPSLIPFRLQSDAMPTRRLLRQFVQYVLVGAVAFVFDFVALFVLTERVGLHYIVSASIAFLLGLTTNYLLCILWIFDYRTLQNQAHEFAVFSLIGFAGLLLNGALMFILIEFLGVHYLIARAQAAVLILLFNFSLKRFLLFSESKKIALEAR